MSDEAGFSFEMSFTMPVAFEAPVPLLEIFRQGGVPLHNVRFRPGGDSRLCPECGLEILELIALGVEVFDHPGAGGHATLADGTMIGFSQPRDGWRVDPCGHVFRKDDEAPAA